MTVLNFKRFTEFTYVMQLHDGHYIEAEIMGHQLRIRYVDSSRNYEGWGFATSGSLVRELLKLNTEARAYEVRY